MNKKIQKMFDCLKMNQIKKLIILAYKEKNKVKKIIIKFNKF